MSPTMEYSPEEKETVYKVIRERRDVRRFRSDPIPESILKKILLAAMQAPSVGYMQPWNFIKILDPKVRQNVYQAFVQANNEAQEMFTNERKKLYSSLKLEGILSSGLNICVTCDRDRFGPVVLGRTCQPEMDLYSTVCAVQNLWLAARCEGIGVGWVSIIKPDTLKSILKLPPNVVPIAYLCIGYCDSFAPEPELKTNGWLPELSMSELVFQDQWGKIL
jgi:5,6-dimethylbenzimidazole synthase